MNKESFKIAVPDAVLTDLRERLSRVRYPIDFANENWAYGTNLAYLEEMVAYWRDQYDWRKHEAEINRFAHYRTTIDGIPIHFIHEPGKGPKPIPLIMSHGWPWTFWDLHKVIRPLTDPASYGGDPADAFDVVVPSLPGYGFSGPTKVRGVTMARIAEVFVSCMQDLGYPRFATQGGDWGLHITRTLGRAWADKIVGIHLNIQPSRAVLSKEATNEAERRWLERRAQWMWEESGYSHM